MSPSVASYMTYIDSQTATEWFNETYPGLTFVSKLSEVLWSWNVHEKRNEVFSRLILNSIIETILICLTTRGDLVSHRDLQVSVRASDVLSRQINSLVVDILDGNQLIQGFQMSYDPSLNSWIGGPLQQ